MKYIFGLFLSLITFNKCGLMNDNPIYKHNPMDIFKSPELEVAQAIRVNNPESIEALVKKRPDTDLNVIGKGGMTLLFWACAHRHPATVGKLLELGADPNIVMKNEDSETHLMALTAGGSVDESFELILKHGGDPNGAMDGTPAVFETVYAQRFDRMKKLLDKGANIDAIDEQTDLSLIHFCAKLIYFNIVTFLLEQGADFERKSKIGGSVALQVQKRKGKLKEEDEKWRTKVEQMLIDRGVVFPVPLPWEEKK